MARGDDVVFEYEDLIPAKYNRDILEHPPEKNRQDKEELMGVLLGHTSFVYGLDKEILETLTRHFITQSVTKDQAIIKRGQYVDYFYIVRDGLIDQVERKRTDDLETVRTFENEGTFMEEALHRRIQANFSFIARSPAKLWKLSRRTFYTVVEHIRFERRKILTKIIQRMPLFKTMHPLLKVRFRECMDIKIYDQSCTIYKEGDGLDGMYVLLKGSVRLHQSDADNEDQSAENEENLVPGQYFGQSALINLPNATRRETAEVLFNAMLAYLDREIFEMQFVSVPVLLGMERARRAKVIRDLLNEAGLAPLQGL